MYLDVFDLFLFDVYVSLLYIVLSCYVYRECVFLLYVCVCYCLYVG